MPHDSVKGNENSKIIKTKSNKSSSFKGDLFVTGSIDIPFLAITIALLTIGLIMLFSASYPYAYSQRLDHNSYYYISRQLVFAAVGVVAMFVMSKINYKWLKVAALPLLGVTLILLVLVLFMHSQVEAESGESFKRWIQIGPIQFQPSDVAKFTIILTLSLYITNYYSKMKNFKYGFIIPMVVIGVFCGLILLEHHLSCLILMFFIGAALMFAGGTDWRIFVFGLSIVIVVAAVVIKHPEILPSYAEQRIIAWTNKDFSPGDKRWQTNNSLYAIGSGGLTGVGLGNSKQKYLYVSEPQNDFIFAIVCEELGFIGATAILFLFGALVWRGIKIARNTGDRFGSLLVIGIVSQVGIQVILNILVVTDTIPNTGIALPFFSYGGTAIMMLLFEMGVVLSVSRKASQMRV